MSLTKTVDTNELINLAQTNELSMDGGIHTEISAIACSITVSILLSPTLSLLSVSAAACK